MDSGPSNGESHLSKQTKLTTGRGYTVCGNQ